MPALKDFIATLLARGGFTTIRLVRNAYQLTDHDARAFLNDAEDRGYIVRRFYGRSITYQLTRKGANLVGFNSPYAVKNNHTDDEARRALSRFWFVSEPLNAGAECITDHEKVLEVLADFKVSLPPNYQGRDDLIIENGQLQVWVYVPTAKADFVIKRALITYLLRTENVRVGFYTAADFVETTRQIIYEYTDEMPPLQSANTVKNERQFEDKMANATIEAQRFLAAKRAGANVAVETDPLATTSQFAGVFLPVKGVAL